MTVPGLPTGKQNVKGRKLTLMCDWVTIEQCVEAKSLRRKVLTELSRRGHIRLIPGRPASCHLITPAIDRFAMALEHRYQKGWNDQQLVDLLTAAGAVSLHEAMDLVCLIAPDPNL